MPGSAIVSDILGYTSIGCWLGAQFPQVLENIRRRSCEGLALPFLANWLLGDVSNLVGCILTHQLPFQTYLAVYFVFVDLSLVSQYVYYQYWLPARSPDSIPKPKHPRRLSIDRVTPHYRTLSAVAANVAATAAIAAQHDEETAQRSRRWHRDPTSSQVAEGSGSRISRDGEEDPYPGMITSFHSEGGSNLAPKRVSWSTERYGQRGGSVGRQPLTSTTYLSSFHMTPSDNPNPYIPHRGRSLQRAPGTLTEFVPRRPSKASRRGASMIFLSTLVLFGFGIIARRDTGLFQSQPATHEGRVLVGAISPALEVALAGSEMDFPFVYDTVSSHILDSYSTPSRERVLGRIFAWLCTTLYLTSRLPQIWKNFVRKSVEGLSMSLFVFAFLGNTFYVASILTSPNVYQPPPLSTDFIRESIPYLLGSGGTLMFDVTIVTQSFIYRKKPKRRRVSTRSRTHDHEEEAGLLTSDSIHRHYSGQEPSTRRGRTSNTSRITS